VNFDLSDEQKMLKTELARLLAQRSTPDRLRQLVDGGAEWDPELWRAVAQMGLLGAGLPETLGGLGLGGTELCVIAEELGRTTAPIPFFSSICLAAEAIRLAGTEAQQSRWLPRLASGEAVGTFAWSEGAGPADRRPVTVELQDGRLTGTKWPVPDAGVAQVCVTVAHERGRLVLALVELNREGVARHRLSGFDQLRPHHRIDFSGAVAEPMASGDVKALLAHLYDRVATYAAFEQTGGAEACLNMARDYTMMRHTFGRQLASYQAVKHNLANIYVLIELARSNAYFAVWALESDPGQLPLAAASARLSATRAYEQAARENLQLHGGIGFTWAADCHFHYRRARLLALSLGGEEVWSDRLIAQLAF
jgi:alkylation response protein AidB-like acyl-CoA dehydrogenase